MLRLLKLLVTLLLFLTLLVGNVPTLLTGAEVVQIVTVVFAFLSAVVGAITTIYVARMGKTVKLLEKNTNSIKDELVKITAEKAHAVGYKEGIESVKPPALTEGENVELMKAVRSANESKPE